ncbi:hypothetical protein [Salana multivorans]|uniref:hypothetical protein n=1 Tax=Salana multivorans TaxID=120377 RepID=UPI0011CDBD72|nr:hypothetical protein [Salana multivorans]
MPPTRRRAALVAALVLAAGWTTTSCGIHLAEAPPAVPTPDAAEIARSGAVEAAERIGAVARAASSSVTDPGLSSVLDQIAAGSATQAETLGGTWTPPPRPTPSSTDPSDPASSSSAPTAATLEDVLVALSEGATTARDGSTTSDPTLGRLLLSVALWRDLAAFELTRAADAAGEGEAVQAVTLSRGGIDDAALQVSTLGSSPELVRGLDGTAFTYEALAARTSDETSRATWVARAAALRRAGDTVAVASGVAGTSNDPRQGFYDVASVLALDETAAVATLEASLAELWVNADAPGALRPTVADAALESYLLALQTGATLAPLDSSAVVLPGLVTPS